MQVQIVPIRCIRPIAVCSPYVLVPLLGLVRLEQRRENRGVNLDGGEGLKQRAGDGTGRGGCWIQGQDCRGPQRRGEWQELTRRCSFQMAAINRLPACLAATEEDMSMLLSAGSHLGTKNVEKKMVPYVWKRRADGAFGFRREGLGADGLPGINIINLGKTYEKILLAARVIVRC